MLCGPHLKVNLVLNSRVNNADLVLKRFIVERIARCLVLLIAVAFLMYAGNAAESSVDPTSEETYPSGSVELDDGYKGDWSDWYGKWVVVSFYAHWCVPCYEEVEILNEFHTRRNTNGIVVLGVDYDENQDEKLDAVKEKMSIRFPALLNDPSARWDLSKPKIIPTTYVIHPSGRLHKVLVGIQTKKSLLGSMK